MGNFGEGFTEVESLSAGIVNRPGPPEVKINNSAILLIILSIYYIFAGRNWHP